MDRKLQPRLDSIILLLFKQIRESIQVICQITEIGLPVVARGNRKIYPSE